MDRATIAVTLLGLAALGGTGLAIAARRKVDVPFALALGHGGIAVAGYVTLATLVFGAGGLHGMLAIAFGCLTLTAVGGGLFFVYRLRNKAIPMSLIAGHAIIASAGYGLLLYAVYGQG